MGKTRLRFRKTGKAKYISHLDLMRTFQRSFMRANIGIKHTEGFNPHAHISIVLPLAVGCESFCELMDVDITDATPVSSLPDRLNRCLPEGIEIISAFEPVKQPGELKNLRFRSKYLYKDGSEEDCAEKLNDLFQRDKLIIIKKTKKGQSEFDLKPHIKSIEISAVQDGGVVLEAVASAQNPSVSPAQLRMAIDRLEPGLSPPFYEDARIEVYDENMDIFK